MELRLALAVVIVLIVAFIAICAIWSGPAPSEPAGMSPAPDAAAAARAMTFAEPTAAPK